MTPEAQQKAAAEMDGCQIISTGFSDLACTRLNFGYAKQYNDYNSIIPLIQKWIGNDFWKVAKLCSALGLDISVLDIGASSYTIALQTFGWFIQRTPDELREGLLKAAGKWKD